MRVTALNYPTVHEVFEDISHDGGGRAGHEWYEVPQDYVAFLPTAEFTMERLTADERETFAIGAEHEQQELLDRHPELVAAGVLLEAFFDSGWERGGRQ